MSARYHYTYITHITLHTRFTKTYPQREYPSRSTKCRTINGQTMLYGTVIWNYAAKTNTERISKFSRIKPWRQSSMSHGKWEIPPSTDTWRSLRTKKSQRKEVPRFTPMQSTKIHKGNNNYTLPNNHEHSWTIITLTVLYGAETWSRVV